MAASDREPLNLERVRERRTMFDPVLLERLTETGFLATEFGMHAYAERIFDCLARVRPGKATPRIALAMVHARRGRMSQAIDELHTLGEQFPDNQLVKAILGTMFLHLKQPGALALFESVIADGTDAGAIAVANCCVDAARSIEAEPQLTTAEPFELFRHYNVRP